MNRVMREGVWIESNVPLDPTPQWSIPLRLARVVAEGVPANLGSVPPRLAGNLETIRDIYAAWMHGHRIPLNREPSSGGAPAGNGVSQFFSGGVDSFYSLIQHRGEVENLVLIHGFDIPLADTRNFALAEEQAREVARLFGKRLIVVRTNLHREQPSVPGGWAMYHGAVLAAISHALAPNHRKIYIASTCSYADLQPWGSHPLLDPLWSTDAVEVIHDGGETRLNKLRVIAQFPEALARLRVCWENLGDYNCGLCPKCVRTMLGLRALGFHRCAAFPDTLTPELVRQQEILARSLKVWREMLCPGLGPDLYTALQSAIHSSEAGLPPRTGKWKREVKRWLYAARDAAKALLSPLNCA
jgi:hypothetical protein